MLFIAAAGSAHAQALRVPGGGTVQIGQRGAATTVTVSLDGRTSRSILPPTETIYPHALRESTLVGAIDGQVVVVSSDYNSNPAGGRFQCGAGTETMVRVIALRPNPHQTFSQLVASCWLAVDSGETMWDSAMQTLTIERTAAEPTVPGNAGGRDAGVADTRTTYRVAADGAVTPVRVEQLP